AETYQPAEPTPSSGSRLYMRATLSHKGTREAGTSPVRQRFSLLLASHSTALILRRREAASRRMAAGESGASWFETRGACHRARIRATRWLAMTMRLQLVCRDLRRQHLIVDLRNLVHAAQPHRRGELLGQEVD